MALIETLSHLEELLSEIGKDLQKVLRGNHSAAQRIRVGTLRMEKVGKLFRKESLTAEKAGKFHKLKKKARKRKT
jgi:hypothetical protein